MRTDAYVWTLLMTAAVLTPGASATGYLLNLNGGGIGSNIFGGQGDTLDIGIGNYQCTDEDDVVDVGIFNKEGDANCYYRGEGCYAEEGHDMLGLPPILLEDPATHPHNPHCSDDGDTVDVGLFNEEGTDYYSAYRCREATYIESWQSAGGGTYYPYPYGGDYEDGVDVGVANREFCDDDDAADVGVLNCEFSDWDDGIDVGLANLEDLDDGSDTLDVSLFNTEIGDAVDRNGLNVGPDLFLFDLCWALH